MNNKGLCKLLVDTTYLVNVYQDDELVNQGSAVCINSRGDLLTAAHVISGRLPVQGKDLKDIHVIAKAQEYEQQTYEHLVCGVSMESPYTKEPISIDLSILRCTATLSNRKYLKIERNLPVAGTEVLMSGYSDEVKLPFNIEDSLDYSSECMSGKGEEIKAALDEFMRFSMSKSGMVGRSYKAEFKDIKKGLNLRGGTFYIDNAMHSGASGGAVINSKGHLVGIITQRAISSYSTENNPGLTVPSGSTIAITPCFLLDFVKVMELGFEVPWTA